MIIERSIKLSFVFRRATKINNAIIFNSARSISLKTNTAKTYPAFKDTISSPICNFTFFQGISLFNSSRKRQLKYFSTSNTDSNINASKKSQNPPADEQKRLDIAIVGAPNAGKSQLLNCIMKSTVAAVSRKKHTTRNDIVGNRTVDNTQLLFVDTPGFTTDEKKLVRDLKATASREIGHSDYVLIIVDAAKKWTDKVRKDLAVLMFQSMYKTTTGEFGVILNKIDLVSPKKNLIDIAIEVGCLAEELINYDYTEGEAIPSFKKEFTAKPMTDKERAERLLLCPDVFMISALKNDGVDDILKFLIKKAPKKEWVMEAHETTLLTPIQRAEEILREKIYRSVHREVPHKVIQVNRVFKLVEKEDNVSTSTIKDESKLNSQTILFIEQDLVVRTESHKKILMGKHRMTLNNIEITAKKALQDVFKCQVSLLLHVKLNKNQHDKELKNISGVFTDGIP